MNAASIAFQTVVLLSLAACAEPRFVDQGKGDQESMAMNPQVVFRVFNTYWATPPDCVAILPLIAAGDVRAENADKVRRSLYAQIAVQSKRSVKLEQVDHVLADVGGDRKVLGERTRCSAVLEGTVTEYGSAFYGVYSRVAVGIDLKMIRTSDGAELWEGRHVAVSHGGSLPIDPVSAVSGVVYAASNVRDEQLLRVADDVARRLVSTIPDNRVVALDDPASEPFKAKAPVVPPDGLAMGEKLLLAGDNVGALAAADRALSAHPDRADAWFFKGRILLLDKNYDQAESAILKAAAMDDRNVRYLNALGAVNAAKGSNDRALAAYRMAIDADHSDGFAWYNTAIIQYNTGNPSEAAESFYGAGLAYLTNGDYDKAERALGDLKELARSGLPVQAKVQAIEDAFFDLKRRKT